VAFQRSFLLKYLCSLSLPKFFWNNISSPNKIAPFSIPQDRFVATRRQICFGDKRKKIKCPLPCDSQSQRLERIALVLASDQITISHKNTQRWMADPGGLQVWPRVEKFKQTIFDCVDQLVPKLALLSFTIN